MDITKRSLSLNNTITFLDWVFSYLAISKVASPELPQRFYDITGSEISLQVDSCQNKYRPV